MVKIKFIETSSSKLDSVAIKPGQFIVDSSMAKLYFDDTNNKRLEFGVNATTAIKDRLNQQIDTTYIKDITTTDSGLSLTYGGG